MLRALHADSFDGGGLGQLIHILQLVPDEVVLSDQLMVEVVKTSHVDMLELCSEVLPLGMLNQVVEVSFLIVVDEL